VKWLDDAKCEESKRGVRKPLTAELFVITNNATKDSTTLMVNFNLLISECRKSNNIERQQSICRFADLRLAPPSTE
jgi:hypothetical protein